MEREQVPRLEETMLRDAAQGLLAAALALVLPLAVLYALLGMAPGAHLARWGLESDALSQLSARDIANVQRILGTDKPWALGFAAWLGGDDWLGALDRAWAGNSRGILRGDLGKSWAKQRPVTDMFGARLPNAGSLLLAGMALSLAFAVPVGLAFARWRGRVADGCYRVYVSLALAVPPAWAGLALVFLLNDRFQRWRLPYMPAGGSMSLRPAMPGSLLYALGATPGSLLDRAVHLIIPGTLMVLPLVAAWSHFVRGRTIELLGEQGWAAAHYAGDGGGSRVEGRGSQVEGRGSQVDGRGSQVEGRLESVIVRPVSAIRRQRLLIRPWLRGVLVPLLAVAAFQLPALFGAAIVSEAVTAYPGPGRLFGEALRSLDVPVLRAYLLVVAVLVVVALIVSAALQTLGVGWSVVRRSAATGMSAMELAWDFTRVQGRATVPRWGRVGARFRQSRTGMLGLALLSVIVLVSFTGPLFAPHDRPNTAASGTGELSVAGSAALSTGPQGARVAGASPYGLLVLATGPARFSLRSTVPGEEDYATRLLRGGRTSLLIALGLAAAAALLGAAIGLTAGRAGGAVDSVVSRVGDYLIALPALPAMLVLYVLVPHVRIVRGVPVSLLALLVLLGWMPTARMVRDRVATLRGEDAGHVADDTQGGHVRAEWRATASLVAAPVLLTAVAGASSMLLTESTLSFLGFGVQPPGVSWGAMLQDVRGLMFDDPLAALLPAAATAATCLGLNLVAMALRSALDEAQRFSARSTG